MTNTTNKPIKTIRFGAIQGAIFANEGKYGPIYDVKISRLYKDGATFKRSSTFNRDDLLAAAKVASEAHTVICELQQGGSVISEPTNGDDESADIADAEAGQ